MSRVLRTPVLFLFLASAALAGPRPFPHPSPVGPRHAPQDVHSHSNPYEVLVQHLSLDLTVDFDRRVLTGSVTLDLHNRSGAGTLTLDTRDLTIHSVTYADGSAAAFTVGARHPIVGSSLDIALRPGTRSVTIFYTTSPGARALHWLTPAQTTDRRDVFLYTQNEPIDARDWIPSQDTPAVRATYDATIRVPPGLLALMSAGNPTEPDAEGTYSFRMDLPVPAYLIALAVGHLQFQQLSERIGVYFEPSRAPLAAFEVNEATAMMAAAERLFGPYRWGRYDVLVLPHTYQVGGMEHARLTFVHPYFLTGDHTLNSLLAHELAHSWAGNLVTLATWDDVWLNEGITTYMERRIMEEVYGRDFEEMLAENAMNGLRHAMLVAPQIDLDTRLHRELRAEDNPVAGFNVFGYQKGWAFIRMLEESLGRETLDRFLRTYFRDYAWSWMDSDSFVAALARIIPLSPEEMSELGIDQWIHGQGLPANAPVVDAARFRQVDNEVSRFRAGTSADALDAARWSNIELTRFLNLLSSGETRNRMAELNETFQLNANSHRGVASSWLLHVVRAEWQPGYEALERYLTLNASQQLYFELMKTTSGRVLAPGIYAEFRERYHPWDQAAIDSIIGYIAKARKRAA